MKQTNKKSRAGWVLWLVLALAVLAFAMYGTAVSSFLSRGHNFPYSSIALGIGACFVGAALFDKKTN